MSPHWTEEEDSIIREHYPSIGRVGVAKMLKRTRLAVTSRALRLGLTANKERSRRNVADAVSVASERAGQRPAYLKGLEEGSREYYLAQDKAFSKAMRDNPTERP